MFYIILVHKRDNTYGHLEYMVSELTQFLNFTQI